MILTKEMLEQSHTAKEYLQWVEHLIEVVKSEENGIELIRLRKGLCKELIEEALPIALFVSKYFDYSPDVIVRHKVGSQHFDATIKDKRRIKSSIKHIEVTGTTAVGTSNGHEDFLHRYHLHRTGEGGTGKISYSGTKKCLVTSLERGMISQSDVLEHEKRVVTEAIDRKLKPHYPKNTALIISFDDRWSFDREDNIVNLQQVIEDGSHRLKRYNFCLVSIVGLYQGSHLKQNIAFQ